MTDREPDVSNGACHTCGAELGGPYCGSCGAWNSQGEPPMRPERVCPVCGTVNSANNRHCQGCAFRLDRNPQPERSPLALVFVGSVLFGIAVLVVLIVNAALGGDPEPTVPETAPTTSATLDRSVTTAGQEEPTFLEVSSVSASSSYSENLGPDNLIDNDPTSYWNDASLHGDGAELTFEFSSPVAIDSLLIQSPADEASFIRNYRVRGYEITTDDLPTPITGDLADSREAETIAIASSSTSRLILRITSTYEPRPFQGQPPFEELAIAEVTFIGTSGQ